VHWVILTGSDATTPTAEQVLNGRASDGKSAYRTGNGSVYANTAISAALSSLESEQPYKICAVARDAATNLSPVAVYTFTTLNAGDTGEEWLNNFTVPSGNIGNNSFMLTVNSSRTGTLYYVVVEDPNRNAKTPTPSYIKNGRNANNDTAYIYSNFSVSAGASRSVDITGLKGGTNYKVFGCVYESSSTGSLYSKVKNAAFTTTGTNVDWITTFDVPSTVDAASAALNVRTNRTGTFYYVVTENTSQPVATQIRDGLDKNNYRSLVSTYSQSISSTGTTYTIPLSGLTSGRNYCVYGVLYVSGSEYSEIETKNFMAGAGASPLLSMSYSLSPTTGSAISFSLSGFAYTASAPTISLSGTNSGANVEISVSKGSSASNVTATMGTTTNGTTFVIPYGNLASGRNTVTFTVRESGRTDLTYTIYIDK
jgi:hypothetical protein